MTRSRGLTRKGYAALLGAAFLLGVCASELKAEGAQPFTATAYCCVGRGGGHCGRTASGVWVGPGQVAADWRVLPAFSRIWVEGYGEAVVTDTGGAIKGNRIDVFFHYCADAIVFGRRTVGVWTAEED